MIRRILAAIAGLILALLITNIVQFINHSVWPTPFGIDLRNMGSLTTMNRTMATGQWIMLLASYALGSLAGGYLIGKIARSKHFLVPVIVGGFLTVGWVMLTMELPFPTWVIVVGLFMFVPFILLGANLAVPGSSDEDSADVDEASGDEGAVPEQEESVAEEPPAEEPRGEGDGGNDA